MSQTDEWGKTLSIPIVGGAVAHHRESTMDQKKIWARRECFVYTLQKYKWWEIAFIAKIERTVMTFWLDKQSTGIKEIGCKYQWYLFLFYICISVKKKAFSNQTDTDTAEKFDIDRIFKLLCFFLKIFSSKPILSKYDDMMI